MDEAWVPNILGLNAPAVAAVEESLFFRCLANVSLYGTIIGSIGIRASDLVSADDKATEYGD